MPAPRPLGGSASSSPSTSSRGHILKSSAFSQRVFSAFFNTKDRNNYFSPVAEPVTTSQTDRDLASIAEARALARRAKQAWLELAEFSQEKIDAIVGAMAAAATAQAEAFARLAVEETGYGLVPDKIQKNLFCSEKVYAFI